MNITLQNYFLPFSYERPYVKFISMEDDAIQTSSLDTKDMHPNDQSENVPLLSHNKPHFSEVNQYSTELVI